ncbi:prolipoprotein diacylglyceryl transferase [Nocardioides marmoriginsengisoli]|uniref:Phosphatidylglycerol--prolipoprotein diacylglyceryl transferase n=1 Tax=Nocardioides marmoriginsengisoli TaxID=661483 RepID=A0A3N0CNB0_9ACTN|nr:prolipoprotein diacylglyceryl transferase [Nocardioides marmoriginsengisoli]RNL64952.1 prolipoprotein diacylglyceryl transferase [Nocardioides marmoriginsengisoli]
MIAQFIPSPSQGVWDLGPLPVRAYALCIILGVVAAVWLGEKRWVARGGKAGQVGDIALWAVPFGLIGARAYHVATDHALYFGEGRNALDALKVWHGGLGIWGAIAGGVLGGALACRRYGIRILPLMDALAPALLLAQAIGRWGNYFNSELFGGKTTKPWGLEIARDKIPSGFDIDKNFPDGAPYTFHPTFLYECIWNLGAMGVVIYLDRKLKLGFGRAFALYVMAYCAGRGWIEHLRIDTVEYNDVLGLRLNVWTSIILFALALGYFVIVGRRHPAPNSREESVYLDGHQPPETDSGLVTEPVAAAPAGQAVDNSDTPDASKDPAPDPETPV